PTVMHLDAQHPPHDAGPRSRTDGTGGHPESRVAAGFRDRGRHGNRFKEESVTMFQTRSLIPTLGLLGGLGLSLLTAPTARAGLIPNKVTVAQDGANYRWTYNVVVTSDLYVAQGDYFTIYDFPGAVSGSVTALAD